MSRCSDKSYLVQGLSESYMCEHLWMPLKFSTLLTKSSPGSETADCCWEPEFGGCSVVAAAVAAVPSCYCSGPGVTGLSLTSTADWGLSRGCCGTCWARGVTLRGRFLPALLSSCCGTGPRCWAPHSRTSRWASRWPPTRSGADSTSGDIAGMTNLK